MYTVLNKAYLYKPKDILKGLLQHRFVKNNDFASFNSSSLQTGSIKNIFNYNDFYFETRSEPNSSFTMTLSHHIIKPTHFSMYSCTYSNCFNSIDVFGSNKGEEWEKICEIRTNTTYFMGKAALIECKSDFFYKSIKLIQRESNVFLFRYFEVFGYLSSIQNIQYTHCFCRRYNMLYAISFIMFSK